MIDPRRDFQHFVRQFADESAALRNSMDALRSHFQAVTQHDLKQMECRLMEQIQAFAARVKEQLVDLGKGVDGVAADVALIKKKLEALNNSPGTFTPADQAALDEIITLTGGTVEKVKALDESTAPEEIPVPEGGPTPPA